MMPDDFDRRTALVTGGTDGIGKEIAFGLARRGIRVIVVGRSASKAAAAAAELQRRSENPRIESFAADLSSMREVERLGRSVADRFPQLHYLVHSAGVVLGRRELTAEGVEWNFAVNYLSRFRLTLSLLRSLRAAARRGDPARVLLIGGAAQSGRVRFDDVNLTHNFTTVRSVLQFQSANDIFAQELTRRLESAWHEDAPVSVNVVKYGVVKTNIRAEMPSWLRMLSLVLDPFVGQSASQAAEPGLELLLSPKFADVTGALFLCIRRFRRIRPGSYVANPLHGARLWDVSARLAGVPSVRKPTILAIPDSATAT